MDVKWADLCSFDAIYEESDKEEDLNVGNSLFVDAKRNLVVSNKFVAVSNLSDLSVVDTEDTILVCKNIRKVVEMVKDSGLIKFHKTVSHNHSIFELV